MATRPRPLALTCIALACHAGPAAASGAPARYVGVLPCADCAGMRVELELRGDGSYRATRTYVDRAGVDATHLTAGRWTRSDARGAQLYRLRPEDGGKAEMLRIDGARALRVVDEHGRDLPSPRPQLLWRSERRYAGPPREISESDAAGGVALRAGQRLIVRLPANPATGYRWTLVEDAAALTAMDATPSFERAAASLLGAGGTETWRLLAVGIGSGTLRFRYSRPWEPDGAAREIAFPVHAR